MVQRSYWLRRGRGTITRRRLLGASAAATAFVLACGGEKK